MYKVEKHVDLAGSTPTTTLHEHLYCDNGDIALDGMWRVDHVDQFDPSDSTRTTPTAALQRRARRRRLRVVPRQRRRPRVALPARATSPHGNAQVKLFVTCIRGHTEPSANHRHDIYVSQVYTDTLAPRAGVPAPTTTRASTAQCAPGYYAVAPGFNFVHDEYERDLPQLADRRRPQLALGVHGRRPQPGVDVYLRCLRKKVYSEVGRGASQRAHAQDPDGLPAQRYGRALRRASPARAVRRAALQLRPGRTATTTTTRPWSAASGSTTRTTSGSSAWTRGPSSAPTGSGTTARLATRSTSVLSASGPGPASRSARSPRVRPVQLT